MQPPIIDRVFFRHLVSERSSRSCQTSRQAQNDALTARVAQIFANWDRPDSPGCALAMFNGVNLLFRQRRNNQSPSRINAIEMPAAGINTPRKQIAAINHFAGIQHGATETIDNARENGREGNSPWLLREF
jgi:hypothetical protein